MSGLRSIILVAAFAALLALAGCSPSARLEYVKAKGGMLSIHYSKDASSPQRILHFYLVWVPLDSTNQLQFDKRFFQSELEYPRFTITQAARIDGTGHSPVGLDQNGFEYDLKLTPGMQVKGRRYFVLVAPMNSNGKEVLEKAAEVTQLLQSWEKSPDEEHIQWL